MSIEQLRREVVRAIANVVRSNILAVDFTITVEAVRAAFDAYDKARDAANKPEQCCAKCGSLRLEPVDGQARPMFEGGEAKVRAGCNSLRQYYSMLPLVIKGVDPEMYRDILKMFERLRDALALLDAKDAKIEYERELARCRKNGREVAKKERDAALSRAEQAEAALAEATANADDCYRDSIEVRQALADRDAAIVGLMDCLIETVGTPRVEALHGKRLDAAYDAAKTFLPAKPAVDPLVAVLEAAGYAVFPEDLERVRAAIERAGGVKAVFGEGV